MGHHGCRGTMAAAMVHHVLLIDVCVVRDMYVKYTFPPNKIVYCSQAFYPTCSLVFISFSRNYKNASCNDRFQQIESYVFLHRSPY